jgi:hypothetical protein
MQLLDERMFGSMQKGSAQYSVSSMASFIDWLLGPAKDITRTALWILLRCLWSFTLAKQHNKAAQC